MFAKGLVTEQIRFSKAFKNTVHVVPFVPPPICGTNYPDLMRAILDTAGWLEKVQKWKMPDYYADLKLHIITGGEGDGTAAVYHASEASKKCGCLQ
jgi:hypothetical protein